MSEFKGTPGPWHAGAWDEMAGYDCMTSGIRCGPAMLDGNNYGEHYKSPLTDDAKQRMIADARLIAAAPDLLAALRELELAANTADACYTHNPGNFAAALRDMRLSAEAALAAITKATT